MKELLAKNSKAGLMLNDICYGHGYVMHEGAMVPTGACKRKVAANPKGSAMLEIGDGVNKFGKTCELKEGD